MAVIVWPGRKGRRAGVANRSIERSYASSFRPSFVGSGSLVFWVRGDLGTTLVSGNVSSWADQSGQANNVTQGTPASRPLWVASGQNGRPYVQGDGIDDILSSTTGKNLFGSGPYTLFFVWRTGTSASKILFENATGTLTTGLDIQIEATSKRDIGHAGAADHVDAAVTNNVEIWAVRRAAASAPTLQVAGVDQTLTNAGNTTLTDPGASAKISLFASAFPTGWVNADIYEVICYNKDLSDAERATVVRYLKTWYAL